MKWSSCWECCVRGKRQYVILQAVPWGSRILPEDNADLQTDSCVQITPFILKRPFWYWLKGKILFGSNDVETRQQTRLEVRTFRLIFHFNTQEEEFTAKSHVLSLPVTHYLLTWKTYTNWLAVRSNTGVEHESQEIYLISICLHHITQTNQRWYTIHWGFTNQMTMDSILE